MQYVLLYTISNLWRTWWATLCERVQGILTVPELFQSWLTVKCLWNAIILRWPLSERKFRNRKNQWELNRDNYHISGFWFSLSAQLSPKYKSTSGSSLCRFSLRDVTHRRGVLIKSNQVDEIIRTYFKKAPYSLQKPLQQFFKASGCRCIIEPAIQFDVDTLGVGIEFSHEILTHGLYVHWVEHCFEHWASSTPQQRDPKQRTN